MFDLLLPELEFVAAEDDVGLIQMMAGLGLPTTFGTRSEVIPDLSILNFQYFSTFYPLP